MKPMRTGTTITRAIALCAVAALMVPGCSAAQRAQHAQHADHASSAGSANLVFPTADLLDLTARDFRDRDADPRTQLDPYTFARNDDRLGSWPSDDIASIEYLEVRQRDFLRTINGRPREFSTTFISTTRRGVVR